MRFDLVGGDSDTAGAIYGQLAGCYYGYQSFPKEWREKIVLKALVQVFAKELLIASEQLTDQIISGNDNIVTCIDRYVGDVSEAYKLLQQCYTVLETNYKPILRKLLPGPRAYKEMAAFEQDVEEFVKVYQETAPESSPYKADLLNDFQTRFQHNRENIKKKLERGGPFGVKKL
jgi:hypothetical protein